MWCGASDVRRSLERQLSFGAVPGYYEGIVRGSACLKQPKRCDLSAGIISDDATGTVTFHLAQADPDFLYKLALTFVAPAPPGTPDAAARAPAVWPTPAWQARTPPVRAMAD